MELDRQSRRWHYRRRLVFATAVATVWWVGAGSAVAQPGCTPSTTPCQTCPPPPPCTPSSTLCSTLGSGGGTNQTTTVSYQTCTGSFAQQTIALETAIGPASICVGPDKSVGCTVVAGTTNFNFHTDTILGGSAVAIPTLSFWALGALAVALGALALRRLAARG